MFCFSKRILWREVRAVSNPIPQSPLLSLPLHPGQNTQFPHDQHVDVHRLLVPRQPSRPCGPFGSCPGSFYVQDHVFFVLQPPCVLHRDQKFPRIIVHRHLFRLRRAPNSQISQPRFLAGERLFLRYRVPFAALLENRVFHAFPNPSRPRHRQCLILLRLVNLLFFRQLCSQILLRGLLGYLIHDSGPSLGDYFTARSRITNPPEFGKRDKKAASAIGHAAWDSHSWLSAFSPVLRRGTINRAQPPSHPHCHSERSRPIFSSPFTPVKRSACAVEESLFALSLSRTPLPLDAMSQI